MIEGLKPYPQYRESGSKWLGAVPSHWKIQNLRTLIRPRNERNRADLPLLSVARERGVFVRSLTSRSENHNVIPEDLSNYKVARAGDLVINKMKAWQGSMGIAPCDGIVSPAYYVFALSFQCRMYLQSLLRSAPYIAHFGQASDGVRIGQWDLSVDELKKIPAIIPPSSEQTAIARCLVYVNGRIDQVLRSKHQLITLLHEQKQALIQHSLSNAINQTLAHNCRTTSLLPKVPQHWTIVALKRHWSVTDCKHITVPFLDEGIPLASVSEAQSFELDLSEANRTSEKWYQKLIEGNRKPNKDDILYCRNVSVGAAAIVTTTEQFAMGQDVCLIRSKNQNNRFLNYLLHSSFMVNQLDQILVGSTFKRINVVDIKSMIVVVPPREEQDAIVGHLDKQTWAIDNKIQRIRLEISLIRQYRTRLTSDVVTGKLDVRAAANLPELSEDELASEEPLEEGDTEDEEMEDAA